ncbi:hypothetical protein RJ641_015580, partial [Dillenia turbinata]
MASENAMRGYSTDMADVHSFGNIALEIVSRKSNANHRPKEEFVYHLDWVPQILLRLYTLPMIGCLQQLVEQESGSKYSSKEAILMLDMALLCTNASPTLRPTISQAADIDVQDILLDPGFSRINSKLRATRSHFWHDLSQKCRMST